MNGRKLKQLRRQFREATGRDAGGVVIIDTDEKGNVSYIPSALRRLKKSYKEAKRAGEV